MCVVSVICDVSISSNARDSSLNFWSLDSINSQLLPFPSHKWQYAVIRMVHTAAPQIQIVIRVSVTTRVSTVHHSSGRWAERLLNP